MAVAIEVEQEVVEFGDGERSGVWADSCCRLLRHPAVQPPKIQEIIQVRRSTKSGWSAEPFTSSASRATFPRGVRDPGAYPTPILLVGREERASPDSLIFLTVLESKGSWMGYGRDAKFTKINHILPSAEKPLQLKDIVTELPNFSLNVDYIEDVERSATVTVELHTSNALIAAHTFISSDLALETSNRFITGTLNISGSLVLTTSNIPITASVGVENNNKTRATTQRSSCASATSPSSPTFQPPRRESLPLHQSAQGQGLSRHRHDFQRKA
ncbi:hypothetical protein MVEN_01402900 [Mycena venus]|uniref:Uncharacterized protein n=1 Tax=Mycena venus TaxID=2733690 RepID=A0A8H6XYS1_9AGAR|nr:hypothetical protein MVEN_01402900 [Mycena venus]